MTASASFTELKNRLAIGTEFSTTAGRYRVTDIGSRTIVAIRIDSISTTGGILDQVQAEKDNWFAGPPYAVAEVVFDEDDYESITIQS